MHRKKRLPALDSLNMKPENISIIETNSEIDSELTETQCLTWALVDGIIGHEEKKQLDRILSDSSSSRNEAVSILTMHSELMNLFVKSPKSTINPAVLDSTADRETV